MKTYLSTWLVRMAAVVMAAGAAVTACGAPINLYWDANGATSGTGGTGPWNLADSTWRLGSATGTLQAWNNDVNGNSAYILGTVGTLTLGDNVTVAYLLASSGYVINGDAGALYKLTFDSTSKVGGDGGAYAVMMNNGGVSVTINAPVVLTGAYVHQFRDTVTFNGVVSGTAGLMSSGNDPYRQTITLTNANTFSGGINLVGNGRFVFGHDQALGTGPITTGGGFLRATNGNRTISNQITPSGGGAFTMTTDGANNLTLAAGAGNGTVGGLNPVFTVLDTGTLTINRPLYGYAGHANWTLTKNGTGTLVLNQSFGNAIGSAGVNINAGTVIVNGDSVAQSTLNGTVVNGSPVITGLSSTTGLRVGQEVTGVTFDSSYFREVITSIDSSTQVTLGTNILSTSGNYNITFSAVGALGYNTGHITVSNAATLGGSGTIVLATGKTNTVLAGGTIAPGSVTAGAEVGTLTVTNGTFAFQQNANYAWQYKDGAGDLVRVYGTLILPTVATVTVSQVSGAMPSAPTLFTATTLAGAGASDVSGWVLNGAPGCTLQISGTSVILKAPPKGTVIMLK